MPINRMTRFITAACLMLAVCFYGLSCARQQVDVPDPVLFAEPPVSVSTDQLFQAYVTDEAKANLNYTGKLVWLNDAAVETCAESPDVSYLEVRRIQPAPVATQIDEAFAYGGVKGWYENMNVLLPYYYSGVLYFAGPLPVDLKDAGDGFEAELVGECQGLINGVLVIQIDWVAKVGVKPSIMPINLGGY
jgi:hypothetical protein